MTNVRNTPLLSVKDQHCIQTTRVICYNIKGVVNRQNSGDKGPPEGNSARG